METLGIPSAYADTVMLLKPVDPSPQRLSQTVSCRRQTQRRFSVRALQRERSRPTSIPVLPLCSPSNEHSCLQATPVVYVERLPSEKNSQSRLELEQMMWRMIRADKDKEPRGKDSGDEPDKTSDSNQLWISKARNIQTTAHIFCSTMFWIVLFFIGSLWDGDNGVRKRRKDRGRRK